MTNKNQFLIIALWVHPRSMSTAVERVMRERKDLNCIHEPFMYYYYIGLGKKELPHFDIDPKWPTSFDGIVRSVLKVAETESVLFKDMSYYVLPEIYNHPQLAKRLEHLFLIRDPRKSILSYHKLDSDFSLEEVGLESQWNLYGWLNDVCERPPFVLEAEAVQHDTVTTMTAAWEYMGLPMKPEAFNWESGKTPDGWGSVVGWHGEVLASSGIKQEKPESESTIDERFAEVSNQFPRLKEMLDHHWPFYLKLKERAVECVNN